jgi:hypothetical protein
VADKTLEKCHSIQIIVDKLKKTLDEAVSVKGLSADPDGVEVALEGAAYFALDVAFTSSFFRHVLNDAK